MTFLNSENYLNEFINLIEGEVDLSIAVAFWGNGAEKLIPDVFDGRSFRIICNLCSGGTNPLVIRRIIEKSVSNTGIKIMHLDNLHAKVAIGKKSAVVGSANLSANGLGLEEGECATWHEAGILVREKSQLEQMMEWFDDLWEKSTSISEEDLKKSLDQWINNRKCRPVESIKFIDAEIHGLKNRNIYIAIYQDEANDKSYEEIIKIQGHAGQSDSLLLKNTKLDFFEDWPEDADEPLPFNAPIITMRYGPRKGLTHVSAWERIPQLDTIIDNDKSDGKVSLTILGQLKEVSGMTFSNQDGLVFAKRLKPWVDYLYLSTPRGEARCVSLDDFIAWESEHISLNAGHGLSEMPPVHRVTL